MRGETILFLLLIGVCAAQWPTKPPNRWTTSPWKPWTRTSPWRPWTTRPWRPWTTRPWRPWTTRPWRPWTTRPWRPWTTRPWKPWTTRPWRPWTTRPWRPWTTRPWRPWTTRPWRPWTTRPWRPWTTRPWRPWTTRPWRPWTTRPWRPWTTRPWRPWTTRPWRPWTTKWRPRTTRHWSCTTKPSRPTTPWRPWTTRPPSRPGNGSCNFDDLPCQTISQDKNDDFDFTIKSFGTPSYETGPSGDHTTGKGKYMYAEASYPRKQGDRARLTAYVQTKFSACFYFHYHMYGASMGTLRVYLNRRLVWQLQGNQGNQWIKATFPVHSPGLFRLDFDAIIGSSFTSDIALDDLGYQEHRYLSSCGVTPSCAKPGNKPTQPPYPTTPYMTYPPISNVTYPPINVTSGPIPSGSCGRPAIAHSRVIGGKDARPGSWPWQVSLHTYGMFVCGGSLISPRWVVTAAHCIFPGARYDVVVGDHNRTVHEGFEQRVSASQIFVHPNWNRSNIDSDIALIHLSRPVFINNRVRPVCLPQQDEYVPPGSKCYITGWGKIRHPGGSHQILQQAVLPVVGKHRCQQKLSNSSGMGSRLRITDNMICGGEEGSIKSGCHGDSGGPFVCQARDGRWVLQGAVSWGSPRCDAKQRYTVFSRVGRFRNWIDYHMRRHGR